MNYITKAPATALRAAAAVFLLCYAAPVSSSAELPAVKIGATLATTGRLAIVGSGELEGLSMAFDEVNRDGGIEGRAIKFIVDDNQGEPKNALAGAQRLLAVDNVQLLISAFTHITQAIKHIPARAEKVMIYISAIKNIAAENSFFFRDFYDIEAAGREMARLAAVRGYKEVAFLREDGESCAHNEEAFGQAAKAAALKVIHREEFSSGSSDIRAVLLRLAQSKPRAILICAWRDSATVMRQMSELNLLTIPTIQVEAPAMAEAADTPEMRALYEKNGTISTWYGYVETTRDPSVRDFIGRFEARYKHRPTPDALLAYDLGRTIADSMTGCLSSGDLDKECFSRQLLDKPHPGVAAPVVFDKTRNSLRPVLVMQVKQGKWVELDWLEGREPSMPGSQNSYAPISQAAP